MRPSPLGPGWASLSSLAPPPRATSPSSPSRAASGLSGRPLTAAARHSSDALCSPSSAPTARLRAPGSARASTGSRGAATGTLAASPTRVASSRLVHAHDGVLPGITPTDRPGGDGSVEREATASTSRLSHLVRQLTDSEDHVITASERQLDALCQHVAQMQTAYTALARFVDERNGREPLSDALVCREVFAFLAAARAHTAELPARAPRTGDDDDDDGDLRRGIASWCAAQTAWLGDLDVLLRRMNPAIAAFRQADEENFVLRGMLQTMSARERAQSSTDLAQSLASLVVEKRANVVSPDVADQACDTSDLMGELCPPVAAPVVVAAPTVAATSAPAPTPLPETSTNVPSGAAPQAVEVACGPDRPIARFVNDYVMVDIPDPAVALLEASTARVAMLEDALAMASERHATATATAAATLQAETARWAEEKRVVSDDCLRKLTASTRQAQDATSKLHTLRGEMETMRVALDDATRTRDELRAMAVTASRNERESHVEQARLTQHVATLTADLGQSASALAQSKERLLELGATLETQVRTTNALMEAKQALEEALAASREQLAVYEARIGTLETAVAASEAAELQRRTELAQSTQALAQTRETLERTEMQYRTTQQQLETFMALPEPHIVPPDALRAPAASTVLGVNPQSHFSLLALDATQLQYPEGAAIADIIASNEFRIGLLEKKNRELREQEMHGLLAQSAMLPPHRTRSARIRQMALNPEALTQHFAASAAEPAVSPAATPLTPLRPTTGRSGPLWMSHSSPSTPANAAYAASATHGDAARSDTRSVDHLRTGSSSFRAASAAEAAAAAHTFYLPRPKPLSSAPHERVKPQRRSDYAVIGHPSRN